MYELGGQAEKTEKISDKRPAETDMPKPQSQIKEKPSMFTSTSVYYYRDEGEDQGVKETIILARGCPIKSDKLCKYLCCLIH